MIHHSSHPLAGSTVTVKKAGENQEEPMVLEDWWDRVNGSSWIESHENMAVMNYAVRAGFEGLPLNDEVVYGKIGPFGYLVHTSELVTDPEAKSIAPGLQGYNTYRGY